MPYMNDSSAKMMDMHDVLILGASGRTGQELIKAFYNKFINCCHIHAFVRDKNKLPDELRVLCASVIEGDATNVVDLMNGIEESNADFIVMAIGNHDSEEVSIVRTECAMNLGAILRNPNYEEVRVVAISCCGAGPGKCHVDQKIRSFIQRDLKSATDDHRGQEMALLDAIRDQTLIVRVNGITDTDNPPGIIETYGCDQVCPSRLIDRHDLAIFIANECIEGDGSEQIVSVTGGIRRGPAPVKRIIESHARHIKRTSDRRMLLVRNNWGQKVNNFKGTLSRRFNKSGNKRKSSDQSNQDSATTGVEIDEAVELELLADREKPSYDTMNSAVSATDTTVKF